MREIDRRAKNMLSVVHSIAQQEWLYGTRMEGVTQAGIPRWPFSLIARHGGLIWKFDGAVVVEVTCTSIAIPTRGVYRRRTLQ
jgi:hypothetical protein